jgi:hypothetical protein
MRESAELFYNLATLLPDNAGNGGFYLTKPKN